MSARSEVTPNMIAVGAAVFDRWMPRYIFGEYTDPSEYAVRNLVIHIFREMATAAEDNRAAEGLSQVRPLDSQGRQQSCECGQD